MFGLRSDLNLRDDAGRRYLAFIIAFMVFLASLATATAIVVTSAVDSWGKGLVGTLTVQIPPPIDSNSDTDALIDEIVTLLRATPGVAAADALDEEESRALLDPWFDSGDRASDLPLPRLIDVRLRDDTTIDTADLRRRIRERATGAAVDDHAQWLGDLAAVTGSVQMAATAVVVVIALAAVLTVIYATRSGFALHYQTIEVLHLMGARDGYITGQFAIQAFFVGLLGGAMGFGVAALIVTAIGQATPPMQLSTFPSFALARSDWVALAAIPLIAALIATFTARVTVLRALHRMM